MVSRNKLGAARHRMDFMTIFMLTFLLFPAYNANKAFEKKDYEKAKNILQTAQVEKPSDPLLNYNLGVIDYKKKNFDSAKQNFSRSATSAFSSGDRELLEKAYFNLGNSFFQNARKILGDNWEKSPPDETTRNQAINEVKSAIEKYGKILEKKQNHKQAQTNKKASEIFLQKLVKQQQEEEQKKKDEKEKKKDKKEEKQGKQEKKSEQDKAKEEKSKQAEEKKEPTQKKNQSKNMEKRQLQALLDKLQESEEKLQKKLMKQKIDKEQKPQNSYQKPW